MSAREKKITLYSRNGIKIERYENLLNKFYKFHEGIYEKTIERVSVESSSNVVRTGKKDFKVKCISPLGFYYYRPITWSDRDKETEKRINASFNTISVQIYDKKYYFEYPLRYKDVRIGVETRPWDILPGYKGIFDHFIIDLYKELNKFFDIIEDNNKLLKVDNIRKLKADIFKDIFGNPDGPAENYNDIKILSHGFDLKQSFRKRKENE